MKIAFAFIFAAALSIQAAADEPEEMSILLFGHSFGLDSTEQVPALMCAAGITNVRMARFYKANCSLQEHYNFFSSDTSGSSYQYYECAPGTATWVKSSVTAKQAIASRAWDYVVFQTSIDDEGHHANTQPYLDDLVSYVRTTSQELYGKQPEICWNLFWPISKLAENGGGTRESLWTRLDMYGSTSHRMWIAYVAGTKRLMAETGITNIVPTGAAIMLLRRSELNTPEMFEFTRDMYHLSPGAGCYAAGCAFFQHFIAPKYGVSVVGNPLRLPDKTTPVTDGNAEAIQRIAALAEENPFACGEKIGSEWIEESESLREATGRWKCSTNYVDGVVEVGGSEIDEPSWESEGRYVKISTVLRFDMEWGDPDYLGEAKAAVRLGKGGCLQAYTRVDGVKSWVDATREGLLTTNEEYAVVLRLDSTNRTYCVSSVRNDEGALLYNGSAIKYPFADSASASVGELLFDGRGAVESIRGECRARLPGTTFFAK